VDTSIPVLILLENKEWLKMSRFYQYTALVAQAAQMSRL
jgi:hypothetical protein